MVRLDLTDEEYLWLKEFLIISFSAFITDNYKSWVARNDKELNNAHAIAKNLLNKLDQTEEEQNFKIETDWDVMPEEDLASIYYSRVVRNVE